MALVIMFYDNHLNRAYLVTVLDNNNNAIEVWRKVDDHILTLKTRFPNHTPHIKCDENKIVVFVSNVNEQPIDSINRYL